MRAWLHGFRQGFNAQLDFEASKIGVTPRAFRVLTVLFWLAVFAVMVPVAARAQVAGLCGPGKDCSVRSLRTTRAASATEICMGAGHASPYWGINSSPTAIGWNRFTDDRCAGTSLGLMSLSASALVTYNGVLIASNAGFEGSVAFSSFPSAASSAGRLLYDSTNTTWRYSNGTSWFPVGPYNLSDEFVIYFPGLSTLLNLPMSRWLAPRSIWLGGSYVSTFGTQIYSATTLVAGVGAGNAVFTIYNVSDAAATTATLTVPCAAAAGTVTASGSIDSSIAITTSAKTFELRLTTNGCTTLPTLNLNVRYTVLPPTN